MRIFWSIAFCLITGVLSAQIKNVPLYPSGITVSWRVAPPTDESEEKVKKTAPQKRKKIKKNAAPEAPPPAPPAVETVSVNRLIRVINAMDLPEDQSFALLFYAKNGKLLPKQTQIVKATVKPSASQIFFVDKVSYREFKGLLDVYFLPKDAAYIKVAVVDRKGNSVQVPAHPAYNQEGLIALEDFLAIEPQNRIMLQFEATGSPVKSILRIASFRFGKAK